MSKLWIRFVRWSRLQALSLFRVNDGSERVARGFTLGALVNFFPTFGFGVVISGFVASICRGNVIAGVLGGALFAVLWPALFYLNMRVGEFFYHSPIAVEEFEDVNDSTIDALVMGKTFIAGAVVNCVIAGIIIYAGVFFLHRYSRQNMLNWLSRFRKSRNPKRPARPSQPRSSGRAES